MSELTGRASAAELAALLSPWAPLKGRREVNPRNVRDWYTRRASTGFPAPVGVRDGAQVRGQRPAVWDVAQVLAWYLEWEPKPGGAPEGNTNNRYARRLAPGV